MQDRERMRERGGRTRTWEREEECRKERGEG
jgi:hypothetical protein